MQVGLSGSFYSTNLGGTAGLYSRPFNKDGFFV
jgi:hypothetical protein